MFDNEKSGSSKQIKALFICKSEAFVVKNWFILRLKVPSIFLKKIETRKVWLTLK